MARVRAESAIAGAGLELIQPVYLNVPMMVSFLAALEGGVSYSGEFLERAQSGRSSESEGTGRAGLPALAGLFGLSFDMSGRFKRSASGEESVETRVVREHTEASLFNLLRDRLLRLDVIRSVERADDLADIRSGQLVEISGEIIGNPLKQFLDVIAAVAPYVGLDLDKSPATKSRQMQRQQNRKGPGEVAQPSVDLDAAGVGMLRTMRDEVDTALVRDLVLQPDSEFRVVLTMAKEFLPEEAEQYMLQGRFSALGKVTRRLAEGEEINLLRRTALGLGGRDMAQSFFDELSGGFAQTGLTWGEPVVKAPALQVLPLAVFV